MGGKSIQFHRGNFQNYPSELFLDPNDELFTKSTAELFFCSNNVLRIMKGLFTSMGLPWLPDFGYKASHETQFETQNPPIFRALSLNKQPAEVPI